MQKSSVKTGLEPLIVTGLYPRGTTSGGTTNGGTTNGGTTNGGTTSGGTTSGGTTYFEYQLLARGAHPMNFAYDYMAGNLKSKAFSSF